MQISLWRHVRSGAMLLVSQSWNKWFLVFYRFLRLLKIKISFPKKYKVQCASDWCNEAFYRQVYFCVRFNCSFGLVWQLFDLYNTLGDMCWANYWGCSGWNPVPGPTSRQDGKGSIWGIAKNLNHWGTLNDVFLGFSKVQLLATVIRGGSLRNETATNRWFDWLNEEN